MRSKIMATVLAFMLTLGAASVGHAAKCKGTVAKIDGKKMEITLKKACKIKVGSLVTIKAKRAGGGIEGC